MGLSGDDRWVVIGGGRGTVQLGDLRDFSLAPAARPPHTMRVDLVRVLPDGGHFVSVDRDGGAVLCDLSVVPLEPKAWPAGDLRCLELAAGGKGDDGTVAALFHDGTVRLFDSRGGGGAVIAPRLGRPSALAVSPDGRTLALGFPAGQVTLRDIRGGKETELPACAFGRFDAWRSRPSGWVAVEPRAGPAT